ncbi:C39 family peptidase [Actinotalea fermentans]|nr:C39 family peptidase [Actinotalea fermentans]KGM17661.1 hypothetical protein N867_16870 [Actinotalea fermentans ATCC 43279 = JCM 9966 = DSM 3133]
MDDSDQGGFFMHYSRLPKMALAAIVATTMFSAPALATEDGVIGTDDAGTGRTDDGARPEDRVPLPAQVQSEANAKAQIAMAYMDVRRGVLAPSQFNVLVQEAAASNPALNPDAMQLRVASSRLGGGTSTNATAAAISRVLAVGSVAQSTNYYCGPAAAYNILAYKGRTVSKYNKNHGLSQTTLASSTYLKTDANGATTWGSGAMRTGLNRWIGGADNYRYVANAKPNATLVKSALVYDIDQSWPFALETYESQTSLARYNNHPLWKSIGHWVTGFGYAASGDTIYIADPSWQLWGGYQKFSTGTADFTNKYLQVHGIIW